MQDFALSDAREMASILRGAKCMARYDRIAHELLSELLVATVTKGKVIGGNNRGSDVLSEKYGKIEVKSRILGTDGEFPRVSLKASNIEKADYFAAMRWHKDFRFYDAIMLPKSTTIKLYTAKSQASGTAHISWNDWKNQIESISLKKEITELIPEMTS